jgi:hypothetical protein
LNAARRRRCCAVAQTRQPSWASSEIQRDGEDLL